MIGNPLASLAFLALLILLLFLALFGKTRLKRNNAKNARMPTKQGCHTKRQECQALTAVEITNLKDVTGNE